LLFVHWDRLPTTRPLECCLRRLSSCLLVPLLRVTGLGYLYKLCFELLDSVQGAWGVQLRDYSSTWPVVKFYWCKKTMLECVVFRRVKPFVLLLRNGFLVKVPRSVPCQCGIFKDCPCLSKVLGWVVNTKQRICSLI
jgi:hypothetical protein